MPVNDVWIGAMRHQAECDFLLSFRAFRSDDEREEIGRAVEVGLEAYVLHGTVEAVRVVFDRALDRLREGRVEPEVRIRVRVIMTSVVEALEQMIALDAQTAGVLAQPEELDG